MRSMTTQPGYSTQSVQTYKSQDISTASPEKCILHLYDIAIQSCAMEEQTRARAAVASLIDALNFDEGGEIAAGLFRLYDFCLRSIHEHEYGSSMEILNGLRETWRSALLQHQAA